MNFEGDEFPPGCKAASVLWQAAEAAKKQKASPKTGLNA